MNRGGTATIQGSVSSIAGAWMSSGRLVVEKDAGDRVGFHEWRFHGYPWFNR